MEFAPVISFMLEYAPVIVGIVVGAIVAVVYLLSHHFQPDHRFLRATCYILVGALIPPIVYTIIEYKHPQHLFFWAMPCAAAWTLLFMATRASQEPWAINFGIRGLQTWVGILLGSVVAYGALLRYDQFEPYCWLAIFFGTMVGAAEIHSRYRDEPWEALLSIPGLVYQAMNGAISAAAYGLLRAYSDSLFPALKNDLFLTSIVAGFGAMAVMRSKLFSFKTANGEEFAVGPDAVITIFLQSLDRAIDRWRSIRRQRLVFESTKDIAYSARVPTFLLGSLASFQNLSNQEKNGITAVINDFANNTAIDPQLKLMAMAFSFLNIGGEENYAQLLADLRTFLGTATTTVQPNAVVHNAAAQQVTFHATVTSPSGLVNEGNVTFSVKNTQGVAVGVPATSAVVAAGMASAVYTLPAGAVAGAYVVTAQYTGTPNLSASSSSTTLTVI